jgi:thioester reductase-like protein
VQQQMPSSRLLIETDMILDLALPLSIETINRSDCKDIFLTGSTGFLGAYLLDELLKQTDANIYCLVRSISSTNPFQSRVFYLHGDLTLPHLGLDEHQYSMLVSKIRSIYHCGAAVNFIKPYNELRAANVLGTVELIKLSYLANCRINYISTLSVLDRNTQSGYVQSKQVAESLLEQASEKGLLITILRPGKIANFYQHLVNFIADRFHIMVFVDG